MDTNSSTYKYVVSVTYYLGLHNAINIYCVPHFFAIKGQIVVWIL